VNNPNLSVYLAGVPAVRELAGNRIYPDKIPQHVMDDPASQPCVVYSRAHVERQLLFCGVAPLASIIMQVDSYATDYDDAEALGNAVEKALLGFHGPMGPVFVDTILPDTESVPGPEPEPGLFRVYISLTIWCREI
jgi:hypothetical protein